MEITQQMPEVLSFEKGNAELTLKQLSKTVRLELANGGLPKSRPIEHFQFIQNIFSQLPQASPTANIISEMETIHCHDSYAKRIMWEGDKMKCPIDKYLIERVVTRILIHREDEREMNQALAISYNEKGIQVALGTNVRVCSNMNIFGSNIISTYGTTRTPFDKMLDVIKHWIQNLTSYYQNDKKVIEALMAIPMDRKLTDEMLGRLIRMAVLQNAKCEMNSPMNVTQVHRMIEGGKELMSKEDFTNYSAWTFTNQLTEVIKPKTSDLMQMLNTNHAVNKFVTDAFNIQSTYQQN